MTRRTKATITAELDAALARVERLKAQRRQAREKAVRARDAMAAHTGLLHEVVLALEERE